MNDKTAQPPKSIMDAIKSEAQKCEDVAVKNGIKPTVIYNVGVSLCVWLWQHLTERGQGAEFDEDAARLELENRGSPFSVMGWTEGARWQHFQDATYILLLKDDRECLTRLNEALEAERDELKRTAFDLLDHRKTMTEMAVQTRDAKIEELKAAHAECLRIIEAQKEYGKWGIDKAISRLTALEAQNARLREELQFYAQKRIDADVDVQKAIYEDDGKRARQALKGAKGEG